MTSLAGDFPTHYRLVTGYPLDPLVAKVLAEAPPEVLAALPGVRVLVEAAEARERQEIAGYIRENARVTYDDGIPNEANLLIWYAEEIESAAHRQPGEAS